MSSTNKTANYELSQFVGTDIPSILSDYNGDMRKIDAGIAEVATSAGSSASAVSALAGRVTTAENSITSLNGALEVTNQRSIQNQTAITAVQGVIPSDASTENKLATSEEVSDIADEVRGIADAVPSTASASNQLVTQEDIENTGHKLLWGSTDSTKTYAVALAEIFEQVLLPLIQANDFATLQSIRIYDNNSGGDPYRYIGIRSTLSATNGGEWEAKQMYISNSTGSKGLNIRKWRFEFNNTNYRATYESDTMLGETVTIGTSESRINDTIPSTGLFVIA